jgi:hypothetical protein
MARKKKPAPRKKKKTARRFQFQLSFAGLAGVAVVMFCLFLWMFLLGIWAGQTILLPTAGSAKAPAKTRSGPAASPVKILRPEKTKQPVPHKSSMLRQRQGRQYAVILLISRTNRLSA